MQPAILPALARPQAAISETEAGFLLSAPFPSNHVAESAAYGFVVGSAHALGLALCWVLALLVFYSRPRATANRLLALLLYFEGLFQGALMVVTILSQTNGDPRLEAVFALALPASLAASCLYRLPVVA
jgi:hypothetical protein